jgi:hypothetical protein
MPWFIPIALDAAPVGTAYGGERGEAQRTAGALISPGDDFRTAVRQAMSRWPPSMSYVAPVTAVLLMR